MRWLLTGALLPIIGFALVYSSGQRAAAEPALAAQAPSFAAQLRYIGRDGATGLPARVDDRFIAEVEEDYANYGKIETQGEPPPPPGAVDLARLSVPALGVDADIARLGTDRFGRLDVPQDAVTVGWHPAFSALPGESRGTFLAAHFAYAGQRGTFYALATLGPGELVSVTTSDGARANYRVVSVTDYVLSSIDMGAILHGVEGAESLTLMTCSGPPNEGEYPLRTVVIATRES